MRAMLTITLLAFTAVAPLAAQAGMADCPLHSQHMAAAHSHDTDVDRRGDQVMGFEHTRTSHHFLLARDGGAIQVEANDSKDVESLQQIRAHLTQVAAAFSRGDFVMTRPIHDRVLPGVPEMARLKDSISYRYEEIPAGARVRIATADPKALEAIHAFLKAQIEDHRTGDSGTVSP